MSQLVLKILVLFRIISIAFVPYQGFPCQFCHDSGELGIIQLNFSLKKVKENLFHMLLLIQFRSVISLPPPRQPSGIILEPQRTSVIIQSLFYSPRKEGNSYLTQNLSLRNPSPLCQLRTRGFHVDTSWHL